MNYLDYDLTTPTGVISLMKSSANGSEWNRNCDSVKAANGGDYPGFWFSTIILSGLMDRTLGKGASDIKIVAFPNADSMVDHLKNSSSE
jgi:hypothetical protein